MASHVTVIDTSARRQVVKVTPGTYLSDVLEEACGKFKLKASQYGLKNNGKQIDLSRTFRLSGLTSGAKLELTLLSKSPSVISVALQLPQSEAADTLNSRLVDKFPSNTTLWQILRKFESAVAGGVITTKNFTARGVPKTGDGASGAGRLYYEAPVLHIVGRDYSTLEDLQKSLGNIGINSGSVLLKLRFEMTERPLEEAMEQIGGFFRTDEEETNSSPQPQAAASPQPLLGTAQPTPPQALSSISNEPSVSSTTGPTHQDSSQDPLGDDIQADDSLASPTPKPIPGVTTRPITVYAPPSSTTPQAARTAHNPADYEPSIDQAKLHQARLNENSRNKRLPSDAEIEAQEAAQAQKFARIQEVEIKIRFPNQSSVVTKFTSQDTAETLYVQVRSLLAREAEPFSLSTTGVKGPRVLPRAQEKLIGDLKLIGKVLVNFSWDVSASDQARTGEVLKAEVAENARQIVVNEVAAIEINERAQTAPQAKEDDADKRKGGGVKKFLKHLSKK